jgi:hypothetical protein
MVSTTGTDLLRPTGSGLALVASLFVSSVALTAAAEPTLQEKSAAQVLFDDARAAMAANDIARACTKFGESYKLDPSAGTLLNLGLCHESEGKTASAYTELNESVSRAIRDQRPEREKLAREHIAAIVPRLSKITIEVDPANPEGVELYVDGSPLSKAAWGVAVPFDPGDHVVEAKAPHRLPYRTTLALGGDAAAARVSIPKLESEPAPPPVTAVVVAPVPAPAPTQGAAPPPPVPNLQRTLAWSAVGVGAVGVVTGSLFGLLAISKWSGAASTCPNGVCPNAADKAGFAGAGTLADVSTISYVIGGIALAAGGVLLITAPRASSPSSAWRFGPLFGPGAAGLRIEGAL